MASKSKYEKFQLVLTEDQQSRLEEIHRRATERAKGLEVGLAYIFKRIIGFEEPNEFVTEADIRYFVGKNAATAHRVQDLGNATGDIESESKKSSTRKKKTVNGD